MRISKLTDYAIMLMVELCGEQGHVLSAQALAERTRVELPTARKLLKLLGRSGLVTSFRGPSGGYRADRSAEDISVAEIIEAIEGPIAMTECSVQIGLCQQEDHCDLRGNWQRLSTAVADAIEAVSLAEMTAPRDGKLPGLRIETLNA